MVKPQDRRYVPLFFSPMLRHCHVDMDCDFKSIARPCAVLEDLSICLSYNWSHTAMVILCDTIRSCTRLVKLCCPLLDFAAWKYISSLPTLVTLEINGMGVDELLNWDGLGLAHFLNLTALSLDLEEPSLTCAKNIATVIQHSEFPSLKKFQSLVGIFPWRQVEQFLRALSRCKACDTLERLEVTIYDTELEVSDNPLPVIGHLLCFTQLRSLRLDIDDFLYPDNVLLLEAMSSWPHIEHLQLYDFGCDKFTRTITFRGLFAGLRLCPNLHTLQVSVDAANIDVDPKAELFQHPALHTLDLGLSRIRDAEVVAFIIFSTLPLTSKVEYTRYFDRDDILAWKEVNRHLESFVGTRLEVS
jgi:hypothetical protein